MKLSNVNRADGGLSLTLALPSVLIKLTKYPIWVFGIVLIGLFLAGNVLAAEKAPLTSELEQPAQSAGDFAEKGQEPGAAFYRDASDLSIRDFIAKEYQNSLQMDSAGTFADCDVAQASCRLQHGLEVGALSTT